MVSPTPDLTACVRSTIRITSRKPEDGVRFWFRWVPVGAGVVSVILGPKERMKLHYYIHHASEYHIVLLYSLFNKSICTFPLSVYHRKTGPYDLKAALLRQTNVRFDLHGVHQRQRGSARCHHWDFYPRPRTF